MNQFIYLFNFFKIGILDQLIFIFQIIKIKINIELGSLLKEIE